MQLRRTHMSALKLRNTDTCAGIVSQTVSLFDSYTTHQLCQDKDVCSSTRQENNQFAGTQRNLQTKSFNWWRHDWTTWLWVESSKCGETTRTGFIKVLFQWKLPFKPVRGTICQQYTWCQHVRRLNTLFLTLGRLARKPNKFSARKRPMLLCDVAVKTRMVTVLSGAEERGGGGGGGHGPSLDRSYFSRLQPISFLFFDPSSSHIACCAYTVLDIDVARAHNACQASEAAEMFPHVDVESFRSQQCRSKSRLQSKRFLCVVKPFKVNFPTWGRSYF